MSEYEYDFYPAQEENMNFLEHSYFINAQFNKSISFQLDDKNIPTNYMPNDPEPPLPLRSISHLDINEQTKRLHLTAKKGQPNETMQLHTNFKTITSKLLKELLCLKLLTPHQVRNSVKFLKSTPSFANFRALFEEREETVSLREKMLKFYSSAQAVKLVLGSQIKMGEKIRLLKFMEKLRTNIDCEQTKKWKGW